jgi:hypothetical protein
MLSEDDSMTKMNSPSPSENSARPAAGAEGKDSGTVSRQSHSGKPEALKEERAKKREEALDEALEETFPASDPPAPAQPTGRGPAGDPATKP